jgi:hypothetical protein
MLALVFSMLVSHPASAVLTEPTYHAADALGYLVVGELEFPRGSFEPQASQMKDQIHEIGEVCPRTHAIDRGVSSFAHFVLFAWPDSEYPKRTVFARSPVDQALAMKRASRVAEDLRARIQGPLTFELVNMATRKPHLIHVAESARVHNPTYDAKAAMEIAGAAPSDAYGLGLFGENGQRSKVVIWVDCKETFGRRRLGVLANVQLASLGAL